MHVLKKLTSSAMFPSLLMLAAILLFNVIVQPDFLSVEFRDGRFFGGIVMILNRAVPVMILAMGMTLVIATGGVDLSVGSVLAVSAAVSITLIRGDLGAGDNATAMHLALVIPIALIVSMVCGLWNGFLVAKIGMPAIVATLIFMVAGRGLTQIITSERSVTTGYLAFGEIANGATLTIPNQIWYALIIFLLIWLLTRRTAFGLFIESVGINKSAAKYAGIRATAVLLAIYTISGLFAGIAGILGGSNVRVIEPMNTGQNMELEAILAVALGGTSLSGGKFNLGGSCVGAIILSALARTMSFYGVSPQAAPAIFAIVIGVLVIIQSPATRKFLASHINIFKRREVSAQ